MQHRFQDFVGGRPEPEQRDAEGGHLAIPVAAGERGPTAQGPAPHGAAKGEFDSKLRDSLPLLQGDTSVE